MLQRHLLLFILCIVGLLTLPPVFGATTTTDKEIETAILHNINAYRTKQHLAPLIESKEISRIAKMHSIEMANGTIPFGHAGFYQRIKSLFHLYKHANRAAENVAYTTENPLHVVPLWIESSGHRHNIEGRFNITGIGIARGQHGKMYATQIFLYYPHKNTD